MTTSELAAAKTRVCRATSSGFDPEDFRSSCLWGPQRGSDDIQ
jgi:Binding domain of Nse4/EID3 to Nse3-MAGE